MKNKTQAVFPLVMIMLFSIIFILPLPLYDSVPQEEKIVISGRVTESQAGGIVGLAGVQMTFSSGGETVTKVTDFDGLYSHEVDYGWSGTIVPRKVSYTFTPRELPLPGITESLGGQNFTATRGAEVRISGRVFTESGAGLSGVVLQAYDSLIGFPGSFGVTGSEGYYELPLGTGWTGQVRAFKDGYTFAPHHIRYDNVVVNDLTGQDYNASQVPLVISGRVTSVTGTGIQGVTLSFTGGMETVSDFNGNYRQEIPHGWSGTVTPVKNLFALSPQTYNETFSNQPGQDYTAADAGFIISGIVTTSGGTGIPGVPLGFSNNGGTAETDANGKYYHAVPQGWSGTVFLAKTGYTFLPAERNYNNVRHQWPGQDYAGRAIYPVIRGRMSTLYDTPISGMRIDVSDSGGIPYTYTYTDDDGMYLFAVPPGWSGTVSPANSNHTFFPGSREYSGVTGSRGGQDYKSGNIIPVISGTVTDSNAKRGLDGVTLTFSNGAGSTETNDSGFFMRPVYFGWAGTLSMEKDGYVFLPFSQDYARVTSDLTGQNVFAIPGRINATLQVSRQISGSLTIKRYYAIIDLTLTVEEIEGAIPISAVYIYRKEDDGEYRSLKEVDSEELERLLAGGTFTHLDKSIEVDKTYTYKAVVIHQSGLKIKESNEIDI